MRSWCFWLCLAFSLAPAVTLYGQDAESPLPVRLDWANFSVVMGRLTVRSEKFGQNMSTATGNEETGVRESFTVAVNDGQTSIRYEFTTPKERLLLEIVNGNQVKLLREARGDNPITGVQYEQDADGKSLLLVGSGPDAQSYHGQTLWHLLLAQPQACRQHLLPLLAYLRSNWDLADTASALEYSLLHTPDTHDPALRATWTRIVADLNAPTFAARQVAERELHEQGLSVVPFLQELNPRNLSAEQRQRVARTLGDVIGDSDDTPERLAVWLAADKQIWLTLLARDDESSRQLAADRLARLVNQPLPFDPAASSDARQQQIERLQKQWAGR